MDNSLSDFQEKKKCNTGPKNIKNNKVSKPKKKLKKVKGQRDIRSLVKNKDSDLVSYSKNFDQVCKKSNIDVDSEQLQLVIALSKSLYETETKTNSDSSQESKPLSLSEKTAKIRTTLQEYGFRVPNTKINKESRKNKRLKKQYKLLLLSDEEKHQNISDRYAEVLATNIHRSPLKHNISNDNNSQELFFKASNIGYEFLRNDDAFYVKDLFEKPLCKSHLLRDWAEIPGRPASPTREISNINFDNIECTQDDLDCILSGSVQAAQDIIKNKYLSNNFCKMDTNDRDISLVKVDYIEKHTSNDIANEVSQVRSVSPDIFDDDISLIVENDTKSIQLLQQSIKKLDNNIDFMDLTECVNHAPETSSIYKHSQRQINETKRKSNDLMEITECVPIDQKYPIENIDLTQSFSSLNRASDENKFIEQHLEMDLTQSNSDDNLSPIKLGKKDENSLDGTVLINESFKVNEVPSNDKLNTEMTPKTESIDSYKLKSCISKINEENVANCSLTNSFHENEEHFSQFCTVNNKPDNLEIDLMQSTHSDDDFHLSQNIRTEKDNSLDRTVVIIENVEFDLNPVCRNETLPIQINPVNVDDLNSSKVDLKYKNSIKNYSESECTKYRNNDELFSEFYGDLISNKDNYKNKKIEEIDLTQPLNFDNGQVAEIGSMRKISVENTVLIDDDIESIVSPVVNEELLILQKHSEIMHNDCNKSEEKTELDNNERQHFGNNSVSYSFNEHVYNTSHIDDYENRLHKDETQEQILTENTSFGKSNNDKSPSYFQLPDCNPCASTSDSHKNVINNTDKVIEDICVEDEIDNIDLTQRSDSSNEVVENHHHPKTYDTNSLGKKDNISIDYDEMFDDVMSTGSKYVSQDNSADNSNNELLSNPSKTSDCFEISDKEFNYSLQQSRHNFDIGGLSIMDNVSDSKMQSLNKSNHSRSLNRSLSDSDLPSTDVNKISVYTPKPIKSHSFASETSTPVVNKHLIKEVQQTPGNSEYIIKTINVTPMLDYESMSSPERNKELEKYGLKPFKRKRAIQLLKHLYNQTHPVVESCDVEECSSPSKKRKYDIGTKHDSPKKSKESPRKQLSASFEETYKENTLYAITKEIPDLREIKCIPDEWVFQKKEKAKVHSCKVPLHIAFHNYVSCRQLLREAILRYEPVNIDVIHKDLVSYGFKYNPKDLLRFLDKKCITVKTTDNNSRNRK